jgi:hypothetical protein
MRILAFCPTARLEPETVASIVNQIGVKNVDIMFTNDNPYEQPEELRNCVLAYAKMRRLAMAEGYDKVWVIESDTIVPPDALKRLLEVDADIVTGLYAHRHGDHRPNIMMPAGGATFGAHSEWTDILPKWGQVIDASGGCMGCLLIDRKALEGFTFEIDRASSPDTDFMDHCQASKLRTKAHLGVICGHKHSDGNIFWPDQSTGYRIERSNT